MELDDKDEMERHIRDVKMSEKLEVKVENKSLKQPTKAHQVLLTDEEWERIYEVYPRDVPVVHPILEEFARLVKLGPQSVIEGTNSYREVAWGCRCWLCEYMLSLPVITGFHLYITQLNRICAGGNPRFQLN